MMMNIIMRGGKRRGEGFGTGSGGGIKRFLEFLVVWVVW